MEHSAWHINDCRESTPSRFLLAFKVKLIDLELFKSEQFGSLKKKYFSFFGLPIFHRVKLIGAA